jgi:uncharacterized membrane protein YedE/YeeE
MRIGKRTAIGVVAAILTVSAIAAAAASQKYPVMPWQTAAMQGKAHAEYIMGNAYAAGMPDLGIPKDLHQAFEWYLKAAKQNDIDAQYEVGAAYILGEGVPRNFQLARMWLKRAAAGGHKDARDVLGSFPAVATQVAPQGPAKRIVRRPLHFTPPPKVQQTQGGFDIAEFHINVNPNAIDPSAIVGAILNVQLFSGYWPWWLGAFALGFITIGFWLTIRNTLGVSSSWDRITNWREDRNIAKAAAVLQEAPTSVLESAMMAATMEQFGDEIPDELLAQMEADKASPAVATARANAPRTPWSVHVTFLLSMVVGGAIATFLTDGQIPLHYDMGKTFIHLFGNSPLSWAVLLVGGFLIGFGTRMGGGCTSGHGLSGCSRLQPGSLVGTASFFGTAIVVSLLLEMRV